MNSPQSPSAVRVGDLTVKFGDFIAVNRISFSVSRGEIFGFLGANGAGKTTTIRVLCGLLIPTSGEAEVSGIRLESGRDDEIKAKVGYMSQKFTLYEDLTVGENLEFAASLRKIPGERFANRRKELLDFIAFRKPLSSMVRDLPGGMKQQVSLAASLLHDPEIIFLDEPTAGVNAVSRARFWELIRSLARSGKTIFVTSHYMDEVEQCDRIALMRTGEIIALDSPAGLKKSTFSEPLFEIEVTRGKEHLSLRDLQQTDLFKRLTTHGLRYHATFARADGEQAFRARYAEGIKIRRIQPSLEDVFIELVEGKAQ